jgi:hypothetical protein
MEILHLLTPFDYLLMVVLCALFIFSLMDGSHKKH